MERALAGSKTDSLWIANKLQPDQRATGAPISFDLDLTDLSSAAASVLKATAEGSIPPDVSVQLLAAVRSTSEVGRMSMMAQSIADLESRLSSQERAIPGTARVIDHRENDSEPVTDAPTVKPTWIN
ncbi:MAG: hypothetical protein V7700_16400 [Halioglobus sp.]